MRKTNVKKMSARVATAIFAASIMMGTAVPCVHAEEFNTTGIVCEAETAMFDTGAVENQADALAEQATEVGQTGDEQTDAQAEQANAEAEQDEQDGAEDNQAGVDEDQDGADEDQDDVDEDQAGVDEDQAGVDEDQAGVDEDQDDDEFIRFFSKVEMDASGIRGLEDQIEATIITENTDEDEQSEATASMTPESVTYQEETATAETVNGKTLYPSINKEQNRIDYKDQFGNLVAYKEFEYTEINPDDVEVGKVYKFGDTLMKVTKVNEAHWDWLTYHMHTAEGVRLDDSEKDWFKLGGIFGQYVYAQSLGDLIFV